MARKPLSKRLRFEVFKRDKFTCQYCGRRPPEVVLEVDHVIAVVDEGTNDQANLVTACFDCNRGKGAVALTNVPRSLADQAAEERERREQVDAYNAFLMGCREADARRIEALGLYWYNKLAKDESEVNAFVFGPGRIPSIQTFLKHLPDAQILEAMDIAEGRIFVYRAESDWKRWRYFCGVCWNMIRRNQQAGGETQ